MAKKPHTLRIEDTLWEEVRSLAKSLKPAEDITGFFERAAYERIEKINRSRSVLAKHENKMKTGKNK